LFLSTKKKKKKKGMMSIFIVVIKILIGLLIGVYHLSSDSKVAYFEAKENTASSSI
jgi:hypothetical protein